MSDDDKAREWKLTVDWQTTSAAFTIISGPIPVIGEPIHVIEYSAYAEAIRERDENHDQLDEALAILTSERAKLTALEARAQRLVEAIKEMISVTGSSTLHAKIGRDALDEFNK